ncbi:hypothetical protein SCOR_31385 [Sulfidibacter corallicola]|uniref:Tetratricopeptide repeat protein n=1 Tax=Sulfidibacter corallicola TaxID=2818388 RepID=A0A8A4TKE5_SULCO|nr:tetratricopeptide repeat protein [Sulfidibacter corallicola]QTD49947.1 hypothetical protein J3U87_30565 [Sulfidibacter corallicola]
MAKSKGSCAKRIAIGCGGLIALFMLFGMLAAVGAFLNKPEPADIQPLNIGASFAASESAPFPGVDGAEGLKSTLDLSIDAQLAEVTVIAGPPGGEIKVSGTYDRNNYDLKTERSKPGEKPSFDILFRSKRSLLGLSLQSADDEGMGIRRNQVESNQVIVEVPKDLLLNLSVKTKMTESVLDLSGLAIQNLRTQMSMGDLIVIMTEPNQVPLQQYTAKSSYGRTEISQMENLRLISGDFKQEFGDFRVRNSGSLLEDAALTIACKFGSMRIEIPEDAPFKGGANVILGGFRTPRKDDTERGGKSLTAKGSGSFGEISFERHESRYAPAEQYLALYRVQGKEYTLTRLKETIEAHGPETYHPTDLNWLGYQLLGSGETDGAIAVFVLNVEAHPDYANGYDSLAEGYERAGQWQLAIDNYKRAYELDPDIRPRTPEILENLERRLKENPTDTEVRADR